jgi:type I restriction enzyme M protein
MAHEQTQPPWNKPSPIPKGYGWSHLIKLAGDELETHYRHTLETLGKQKPRRPGSSRHRCCKS